MVNPYFDSTLQEVNWDATNGSIGSLLNGYGMTRQKLPYLNQQIASSQYDQNSAPTYTAGSAYSEAVNSKTQGPTVGEIGAATAAGAASGGVPGAVIGAAASTVGGLVRKNQQDTQKNRALARAIAAQQSYNQQDLTFRGQQNQRTQYLRRTNPYAREYMVNSTRF